jgi:hypothetical protein
MKPLAVGPPMQSESDTTLGANRWVEDTLAGLRERMLLRRPGLWSR